MNKSKINRAGIILDAGNSVGNKTGGWRTLKPIVDKKKCIGCGRCVVHCPDMSINLKNKKAEVDYDYCKGCAICATECPVKAIKMIKEEK